VDELSSEYDAVRPAFAETGSPRLPGGLNIGAQLFWQSARFAQEFARTTSVLMWPQYWVYKLCGMRCNDVSSLGAHTDLYDPHRKRFSSLVESQHWQSMMPANEPSGKAIGCLSTSLCEKLGMINRVPVHVGIHDSNASLVPHLLGNNGAFSVVSTGTWTICMSVGGDSVELNESRDCLYNVNAFGEPVASARFMGGRERELLLQQDYQRRVSLSQHRPETTTPAATPTMTTAEQRYAAFERLLNQPPDQAALVLPCAVKGAGPYPYAHSAWIDPQSTVDITQRHGDHAQRAVDIAERECIVSLYLALMSAECLSLIGSRGPTHIEGPSAHDPVYTRMLSVASGRPVRISRAVTGTSVGAAMLIARPQTMPEHTTVTCDATDQQWLTEYAGRWRDALSRHVIV
jgi:sugar (pentulose or hexulose) kinase